MDTKQINDIELIRTVMEENNWKQKDVAQFLGVQNPAITKTLNYDGYTLHPASRKLLKLKLEGRI